MAKYITLFDNTSDYESYVQSEYYVKPHVSHSKDQIDKVYYELPPETRLVCKYNVTDTSSATKLLHRSSNISAIEIDGTTLDNIVTNYTFNTTGEHTVKYTLIDNTITGNEVFYQCTNLTSVTIPNSVTSVDRTVFSGCSGLTSVTIGNLVTSIGNYAFQNCSSLTNVTIPSSVTSIGISTFSKCSNLTSIIIPNSVTSIGQSAFGGCSALTSMTVVSGNSSYDSRNNCNAIIETTSNTLIAGCKNTIIPNSITNIGANAFAGCTTLTSMTIPNSVTSIDDNAFNYCSGLTSIIIPTSVISIGNYAFSNCSVLTNVTIGNLVTSIGKYAFSYCSSLMSMTIPNSVTSIGDRAFFNCSSLTEFNFNATNCTLMGSYYNYVFSNCTSLTIINIGNNVQKIPEFAFCSCSSLASVTIPNSVTSIDGFAFSECSNLTTLTVQAITPPTLITNAISNNANLIIYVPAESVDTYKAASVWSNYASKIQAMPETRLVAKYTVNNSLTIKLLNRTTNISIIEIDGVTLDNVVTNYTFSNTGEHTVKYTLIDNTTIDTQEFKNCSNLTSIIIPANITSIGNDAFYGCMNLSEIYFNATNCSVMGNSSAPVFHQCLGDNVYIGNNVQTIPDYAFYSLKPNLILQSTTPPALSANAINEINMIKVPYISVYTYKNAPVWSTYADRIEAI